MYYTKDTIATMKTRRRSPTDRRPLNTEVLNLRTTQDEKLCLVAEAAKKGVSISDVLRARIFGSEIADPQEPPSGQV